MNRTTRNAVATLSKTVSKKWAPEVNHDITVINAISLVDCFTDHIMRNTIGERAACKRGCPRCCTAPRLKITLSELRYIQRYMRDNKKIFMSSASDKACPMLSGGLCSVYPVRPIMCRGWISRDASWCESPPRQFVLKDESTPISYRAYLAAKSVQDALCYVLNEKAMPVIEAIGRV